MTSDAQSIPPPVFRSLRVFAVDPGMTAHFETAVSNEVTLRIPWEPLGPGPVGEYLEVIDADQSGTELYPAVDLDRPALLAQHGLAPSDGSPQFRQQMVYAVAMKTIRTFENALGRLVHWAPKPRSDGTGLVYQRRLPVFPNYTPALNAFHGPAGLCFGYSLGGQETPLAGTLVFTCLSQDVIAHELSHALLIGMDLDFDSAGDASGLHEAFADLIALFGHFGDGAVLREQISAVRGDLAERNQLGAVALQLGEAVGRPDGLRNALGHTDEHGVWQPRRPDPRAYLTLTEPHDRGDILVGAVFEAFRKIYESRVADLRRIASRGSGVLAAGRPHPDLVARLSREAAETARLVQQMCIRAVDYLPPVDVTFGDYLRALVTADHDVYPDDERRYRVALIDGFRGYGITPADLLTVSEDTLLWSPPADPASTAAVSAFFADLSARTTFWNLPQDREELWTAREGWKRALAGHLRAARAALGPIDVRRRFEVRSCDLRQRPGSGGALTLDWIVKIVQGARGRRVGCTLVVDAQTAAVRYLVAKSGAAGDSHPAGQDLLARSGSVVATRPTHRRLRVFASDPNRGIELETAGINEVTLTVPWHSGPGGGLAPGPAGEYVEVVDHDPASGCYYAPIDLDNPGIVSQDGMTPSESNPQFHQQMVFAVAMRVIQDFERVLGRLVLWSPRRTRPAGGGGTDGEEYVPRLRIHPHALRESNAYYSPAKKALLFGYFPAPSGADGVSGRPLTVFSCLSHDIVAHEVTHALLDGIHRRFNEPSNPDVLAFHEAFADLVALFSHFSLPEVLRQQIAGARGDLAGQNQLGELAQQFGWATGRRGALRGAIGAVDPATGQWAPTTPDPQAYERITEPHERGAILVAAVFGAFLTSYKARVADLLRIATEGTGVLPAGHLHPDLVDRLADEAARAARRVLDMCIRALDYCPPVDITFGDYLRAVITADHEFDPVDERHDRVAFVEAFRRHGIVPDDVRTLAPDGLLWRPAAAAPDEDENVVVALVQSWAVDIDSWHLTQDRQALFELMARHRAALHAFLTEQIRTGQTLAGARVLGGLDPGRPFEVHSIRPSAGTDWHGWPTLDWVIELTQGIPQFADPAGDPDAAVGEPLFTFRGGCTLIVDARSGRVRYSIKKPLDEARLERQRSHQLDAGSRSLAATYFGGPGAPENEPFAMLHRG